MKQRGDHPTRWSHERWRAITVVGMIFVAMMWNLGRADAFTLEGPIWPGQPSPNHCCATLTYENFAGDSKDFNAGTMGATAWNNSFAEVYYALSSTPDINFEEAKNSGVSWDGLTTWTTYVGGNGVTYFNSGMTVQVNDYYLRNYSAAEAQSVSAHEFGHAAGLGHNSVCVLMNPYTYTRYSSGCGYINTPQADDNAGVDSLY